MSVQAQRLIIPLISLCLGVVVTTTIAAIQNKSAADSKASLTQRFEELEPQEQEQLLDRALVLSERWEKAPQERARLEQLHTTISGDEELSTKLDHVYSMWTKLDDRRKRQLKESGKFKPDWTRATERLIVEQSRRSDQIAIRFFGREAPILSFPEQAFREFLEDCIPDVVPESLQKRLAEYPADTQNVERTLAKAIWVADEVVRYRTERHQAQEFLRRQTSDSPAEQVSTAEATIRDARQFANQLRGFVRQRLLANVPRNEFISRFLDDERTSAEADVDLDQFDRMIGFFLDAGIDHFESIFQDKHLVVDDERILAFYDELDVERRIQLMSKDPADARQDVEWELGRNPQVMDLDADILKMAVDLTRVEETFRMIRFGPRFGEYMRNGRGRGPGGPRSPGDRPPPNFEGPPPEGPPPNGFRNRPPRSLDGERRPNGRDGGRRPDPEQP